VFPGSLTAIDIRWSYGWKAGFELDLCLQTLDSGQVHARAGDFGEVVSVRREIDALRRLFSRHAFIQEPGGLRQHVAQVTLPRADPGFALTGPPCAGNTVSKFEHLHRFQRGYPFGDVAVGHIRQRGGQQIARAQNPLAGQQHHDVVVACGRGQCKECDLSLTSIQRESCGHPERRWHNVRPCGPRCADGWALPSQR